MFSKSRWGLCAMAAVAVATVFSGKAMAAPDPTACDAGSVLSHLPDFSEFTRNAHASVRASNQQVYQRYGDVNATVTGIRWWGITTTVPAGSACTISSPSFTVSFHEDNISTPGGTLESFTVTPTITDTGVTMFGAPVLLFEATFANSITLPSPGWLSVFDPSFIQTCRFSWVGSETGGGQARAFNFSGLSWSDLNDDVSFCLIGTETEEGEGGSVADPDLSCGQDTLFGQTPDLGPLGTVHFSVRSTSRQVYERFTGVTEPIVAVRWWGAASQSPSGTACNLSATPLEISFASESGLLPGGELVSYVVTPSITDTGLTVAGIPLLLFEATLPESVSISGGNAWVSVYDTNINATCRFGWASSLDGNGQAKRFRFDNLQWEDVNDDLAICLLSTAPPEGEGITEGALEGGAEGSAEGSAEGVVEGTIEGTPEGEIDPLECGAGSLISNLPDLSEISADAFASVRASNQQVYQRYGDVNGTVTGIRWWGISTTFPAGSNCDIASPSFTVSFHEDNLSLPGGTLESFTVTPTITNTGVNVFGVPVKLFEATFPNSITLPSPGWLSVYDPSFSATCRFSWVASETGGGQAVAFNFSNLTNTALNDDVAYCLLGTETEEGEGGVVPDPETECTENSLFGQTPDLSALGTVHFSVRSANRQVYERFTGVTEPIVAVRWWGAGSLNPSGNSCDLSGTPVQISFASESGAVPGGGLESFTVTPTITSTGQTVVGLPINLYEAELPSPVTIEGGTAWVSVYDTNFNATCRFGWASSIDGNGQGKRFRFDTLQWEDVNDDLAICLVGAAPTEGEGVTEGIAEGSVEGVVEGVVEGNVEGTPEGSVEGTQEGAVEGTPEGSVEGTQEGAVEGTPEGSVEGTQEGAVEGSEEGQADQTAYDVLQGLRNADTGGDGKLNLSEFTTAFELAELIFDELDLNEDGFLSPAELQRQVSGAKPVHNADQNGDNDVDLSELLRVIQLYNAQGYDCTQDPDESEDGFDVVTSKALSQGCVPHASDYLDGDGVISLSELLRLIQFYNLGGLLPCGDQTEDGFCTQ